MVMYVCLALSDSKTFSFSNYKIRKMPSSCFPHIPEVRFLLGKH